MSTLRIEIQQRIARPVDVVRAQAMDMAQHIERNVHQDLRYTILEASPGRCRVRAAAKLLGIPQVDELELVAHEDGTVTQSYLAGPNKGLEITSQFHAIGDGETLVRLVAELPLRGWKKWLKPILATALRKIGEKALEEDRRDLEEGCYQPRAAKSKAA